jgi:hypothetical protein
MKTWIVFYFSLVLVAMLAVTGWASTYENVIAATIRLVKEPWVVATLFDCYFAFFTFFFWVCYKEKSNLSKTLWFLGIAILGNFAIAGYILWEVKRMGQGFSVERLISEKKA